LARAALLRTKKQSLSSGQAKNDDTTCVPETSPNIQWWNSTPARPPTLGVTDQYHTKPQPDPDWNGTAAGRGGLCR